jgi:catechol 2,3-dioxygenase-like lactoylglutathione lyase family enzyme
MLDHVSLRVQDLPRALAFYRAALAPIGYRVAMEFPNAAGLGDQGKMDLWITLTDKPVMPAHLAFRADRARVDAFHAAALAAGGTDNGAPGLRADYHPHYYAAYVIDPDGNNIEVVCHDPPGQPRKLAPARGASPRRPAKKVKRPARKPAKKAAKPAAKPAPKPRKRR